MARQTLQCDKCMKRYEADIKMSQNPNNVACPYCKNPLKKIWDKAPYGVVK